MKIAIAQLNPVIGDYPGNCKKIIEAAEKARNESCELVVFPEMAVTGYPPKDLLEKRDFVQANLNCLQKLIDEIDGIGVVCGYIDRNESNVGNHLFNSGILFEDGKIIHKVNKRLLPTYDVFDERRYFEPGRESLVFEYKGRKVGLTICEDLWNDKDFFRKRIYRTDPVSIMKEEGAELIINISASPFNVGKQAFRHDMLSNVAGKHEVDLIYANQVGGNDSLLFDGISAAYTKKGQLIARATDFQEDLIFCDTEKEEGDIRAVSKEETESILKALVMGTRDYVTKCGFGKVVIGSSGGIDSALTAVIAVKALGSENVLTVFMPSKFTSDDNFEDTKKLADNLGIDHKQIPIKDMFDAFINVSPEFDDSDPGVTEQNIQARIRGTLLMAFSNKEGRLVLTTGNKSELAVGYCTLYGDMNGGLAVISDVPKTLAYEVSRFINREEEIIPVRIIEKAPSAELKPDQTDQDDLPDYDTLDKILKAYVEEFKSIDEIIEMGFDQAVVMDVVRRVNHNEYKRQQAATGLRITSKAFGYGRRYPIAQRYNQ